MEEDLGKVTEKFVDEVGVRGTGQCIEVIQL